MHDARCRIQDTGHESLEIKTPAKINLGLRIKGSRSDGYHEIETTMQMIGLFDELLFEEKDRGLDLKVDGEVDIPEEGNIITRAFKLLRKNAGGRGVMIRLKKNIPVSAGLGGGSSDGAATLIGLNKLWKSGLQQKELMQLGKNLGSDVPFFIFGPSALATGRGDTLTPVRPLNAWVLLINPNFPVSTLWAYQNYDKLVRSMAHKSKSLRFAQGDIAAVCHSEQSPEPDGTGQSEESCSDTKLLTKSRDNIKLPRPKKNAGGYCSDLERVTIERYPEIETIKDELIGTGASIALMSGSGPTVFGIFHEKSLAVKASKRFKGYKVFIVKTLTESPLDKFLRY